MRSGPTGEPSCLTVGVSLREALFSLRDAGEGVFMMKTSGLTMLKKTRFGEFESRDGSLVDSSSGLHFISKGLDLILFRCPVMDCMRVAWMTEGSGVAAYLSFEKIHWESGEAKRLKEALAGEAQRSDEGCLRGCHQWLDDWSSEKPAVRHSYDRPSLIAAMSASSQVRVDLDTCGVGLHSGFQPSLVDVDGEVLRISDRERRSVVFADMGQATISCRGEKATISN